MYKKCSKCGKEKSVEDFRLRLDKRIGLRYYNNTCRICDANKARAYYQCKKNDPDFIRKNRSRAARHSKKHAKELWEKRKNDPKYLASLKRWRAENKELVRFNQLKRSIKYHRKNCDGLTDKYIKTRISSQLNIQKDEVTTYYIDLKRTQIKAIRLKKKLLNHETSQC